MATALPYLPSNKNLTTLFEKIASAKVPSKFTHEYLQQTLGLKGSNDRPLIPLLRTLGFVDQSGTPTARYPLLKNPNTAKKSLGAAVKAAYKPLFDADEKAASLPLDKIKGLIAQVAGTDDDMTSRIASTFSALVKIADVSESEDAAGEDDVDETDKEEESKEPDVRSKDRPPTLRPEFHYNIQIHLPANASEEVYLSIFNALRKVFQ
jgi:hypothetical protein